MNLITINVGGSTFVTSANTLKNVPETRLSVDNLRMQNYNLATQQYFFDRDPDIFTYVLNYYRTGELHLPPGACSSSVLKELDFWMISSDRVQPCCWKTLYSSDREISALKQLTCLFQNEVEDRVQACTMSSSDSRVRHLLWMFLEYPNSSLLAKLWEVIYFSLIILSTAIFILESVADLRTKDDNMFTRCGLSENRSHVTLMRGDTSKVQELYFTTSPLPILTRLDVSLTAVFTAEFILRLLTSPRRWEFMKGFLNILDLIFILCKWPVFYIEQFVCGGDSLPAMWAHAVLKTFTLVRLLRLLRIGSSCQGFRVMLLAMKSSSNELLLMLGTFACATVICAVAVYIAEMSRGTFENMLVAWWWAVVTMTTVGYGDMYPRTPAGMLVGVVCAMTGLIVLTLPIAVIGTNFADYYRMNRARGKYIEQEKQQCPFRKASAKLKTMFSRNRVEHMNRRKS